MKCTSTGRSRGWLSLLERRSPGSRAPVMIAFDFRVIFVCSMNCAKFSIGLSEVAPSLEATSTISFLAGRIRFKQRWPLARSESGIAQLFAGLEPS
jgi:hypothetical protein